MATADPADFARLTFDEEGMRLLATYGFLIAVGQLIEQHLRVILCAGEDPVTRTRQEFEDAMSDLHRAKHTLARLIRKLNDAGADAEIIRRLRGEILDDRNILVHHYFFGGRGVPFGTPEGRRALLKELEPLVPIFNDVYRELGKTIRSYLYAFGVTEGDIDKATRQANEQEAARLRNQFRGVAVVEKGLPHAALRNSIERVRCRW